jgi:hypothetical protein
MRPSRRKLLVRERLGASMKPYRYTFGRIRFEFPKPAAADWLYFRLHIGPGGVWLGDRQWDGRR